MKRLVIRLCWWHLKMLVLWVQNVFRLGQDLILVISGFVTFVALVLVV